MKTFKKTLLFVTLITLIIWSFWATLSVNKSSEKNLEKINSDYNLDSNDLVANFVNNTAKANGNYVGKIIEVTGFVKQISFLNNRKTVILYTKNQNYGVICDVSNNQLDKLKTLKKHQKITVKGTCKGFLMDVILLNCYIDLKTNE